MRILLWHVHGSWTDAFVHGRHEYLLPTDAERSAWGLGRGGRDWPDTAREVDIDMLTAADVDVVVLQRPEEIDEVRGRLDVDPGVDVPAVFVEHNTPRAHVPDTVHPLADRTDIPLAHVTHFNAVMWDNGRAPVTVIEHGIRDPGPLYTGELDRLAFVANEPVRRRRVLGTDIVESIAEAVPVDVFGIGSEKLGDAAPAHLVRTGPDGTARLAPHGDVPLADLHRRMARRRAYLHPVRWTSLGLSLLEAMHLGMPVIVLAATEAIRAVPAEAGLLTTDPRAMVEEARRLVADPARARDMGAAARAHALERYGLPRFLRDWDELLTSVAEAPALSASTPGS
ncbi:glycosyl transferase family 1 [Brevibacterium sanguinis]|uniref:Glycosyl transferase family 1 n=2 Tax=Brevibacterium TaxID=1696 RepID=A0A366IJJ6_9MICO|nr:MULTISPECIES: glycosyltransferase [Brevibacterium]RBP65441.1 glycosyl transferase family 1 [Brevibacterium sanguinis]RBP72075.1 glycosyl transferase family 1 [Brevibacterium celere]